MSTSDSVKEMRTTYSFHESRGKVKILVTVYSTLGVVSTTVTSVGDIETAAPIVDVLNQISTIATEPLTKRDKRGHMEIWYPDEHLAALGDLSARGDLLEGSHGLWYEYVKTLLYQALADLDKIIQNLPAPVQTAIAAELAMEARGLYDAVARRNGEQVVSKRVSDITGQSRSLWDARLPLDGGNLHRLEAEEPLAEEELEAVLAGLRVLIPAFLRSTNEGAALEVDYMMIADDPGGEYLIEVLAPMSDEEPPELNWDVEIWRRTSEGQREGEPTLRCRRSTPPSVEEITALLDLSGGRPEQLAIWAKAAVGDVLNGTDFKVTERPTTD